MSEGVTFKVYTDETIGDMLDELEMNGVKYEWIFIGDHYMVLDERGNQPAAIISKDSKTAKMIELQRL